MTNIIINDGNIYDANEYGPEDFDGAVLVVDYTVEHQHDTYEGHGLHVITESFVDIEDAHLAYWDGDKVVKTKLSDNNIVLSLLNKFYDH
jgi:hypothetical protein